MRTPPRWELRRAGPGGGHAPDDSGRWAGPGGSDCSHRSDHSDDDASRWLPAVVPGSVGASPEATARYGPDAAATADRHGWSWRTTVSLAAGDYDLVWSGVATYATFVVDGRPVATSDTAFCGGRVSVGHLADGDHELRVDVAPLGDREVPTRPRARWRSALVPDRTLRRRRTPLLGRIPTWRGAAPPVGVLGECALVPADLPQVTDLRVGEDGTVTLHLTRAREAPRVQIDGADTDAAWESASDGGIATVHIPQARRWWPHTHGTPTTYRLTALHAGRTILDRLIGVSSITADRSHGRFALAVNGVPVFVRGACWVPPDPVGWRDDPDELRRDLGRLAAAGINLVRVTGTNRYEPDDFFDIAASLGLLVWQDVMLATFDPPTDEEWLAGLEAEFRHQLGRLQGRPNVAVVCGGTETLQQPTLLGLDPAACHVPAIHDVLPRVADDVLPHVPLVESSPSGGALPVSLDEGVSHYFGVGAYERGLDDAVTARVSFASEALAFSIPAERASVRDAFGDGAVTSAPTWEDGVPGDRGVSWTFADTTAHYVRRLFDVERQDVTDERWLDLQRAAVTHAMTSTFAAWRTDGTPTRGGIVLSHRDLADGPGWGLIDRRGRPKAPLLALSGVLSPRAVVVTDRGLDGVGVWLVNDTTDPVTGELHLEAYADANPPAAHVVHPVVVPARGMTFVHVEEALGGFRDLTWSWRFGPPHYRVLRAAWAVGDDVVAESVAPLGPLDRLVAPASGPLEATHVVRDGALWVTVRSDSPHAFVHLDAPGWIARHGWIHVAPGHAAVFLADPDPSHDVSGDAPVTVRSLSAQAATRSVPC